MKGESPWPVGEGWVKVAGDPAESLGPGTNGVLLLLSVCGREAFES